MKKFIAGFLILTASLPIALMTGCGTSSSPTSTNATATPTVASPTATVVPIGPPALSLGTALSNNFAVLAGTGYVTNAAETIYGNVGVNNAAVPTGPTPVYFNTSAGNPFLNVTPVPQAITDIFGNSASAALTSTGLYASATLLYASPTPVVIAATGTTSITPGVYSIAQSSIAAGVNITLENGSGNPNNVYIFFIPSLMTFGGASTVTLHNVKASNVFWLVGNYMTFGAGSTFAGNIIAYNYVTFAASVALEGRVFADNYVTFSGSGTDSVTNP